MEIKNNFKHFLNMYLNKIKDVATLFYFIFSNNYMCISIISILVSFAQRTFKYSIYDK